MSRRLRRLAFAAPVAALIAAATGPADAAGAPGKPRQITIAFTGDVGGYLEPCG